MWNLSDMYHVYYVIMVMLYQDCAVKNEPGLPTSPGSSILTVIGCGHLTKGSGSID